MQRTFLILAAIFAFLGVVAGTFAAHVMDGYLANQGHSPERQAELLDVFETGVRYHIYHALALLGVAWAADRFRRTPLAAAGWLFVAGIVLFAGSLYAYTLTDIGIIAAITPVGGTSFLAGWLMLLVAAVMGRPEPVRPAPEPSQSEAAGSGTT